MLPLLCCCVSVGPVPTFTLLFFVVVTLVVRVVVGAVTVRLFTVYCVYSRSTFPLRFCPVDTVPRCDLYRLISGCLITHTTPTRCAPLHHGAFPTLLRGDRCIYRSPFPTPRVYSTIYVVEFCPAISLCSPVVLIDSPQDLLLIRCWLVVRRCCHCPHYRCLRCCSRSHRLILFGALPTVHSLALLRLTIRFDVTLFVYRLFPFLV